MDALLHIDFIGQKEIALGVFVELAHSENQLSRLLGEQSLRYHGLLVKYVLSPSDCRRLARWRIMRELATAEPLERYILLEELGLFLGLRKGRGTSDGDENENFCE